MKSLVSVVGIFLIATNLIIAQNSWDYSDYEKYSHKTFKNNKLFTESIDFENIDYPRIHAAIYYVTNEVRENRNLPIFEFNLNLEIAAFHHSKAMAEKNFFAHINSKDRNRRDPNDRAKIAGITNPYLAENVAETPALQYKSGDQVYILDKENAVFSYEDNGTPIPEHTYLSLAEMVVDQWMNSKPHKKNIISKDGLQLGCGVYFFRDKKFYNMPTFKATQNFQWYEKVVATESQDPLP
jgi:uncharacterized protein YkwD